MTSLKRLEEWEIPSSVSKEDVVHFQLDGHRLPPLEELTRFFAQGLRKQVWVATGCCLTDEDIPVLEKRKSKDYQFRLLIGFKFEKGGEPRELLLQGSCEALPKGIDFVLQLRAKCIHEISFRSFSNKPELHPDGVTLQRFIQAHPGLQGLSVESFHLSSDICRCMASVKALRIHSCSFTNDSGQTLVARLLSNQSKVTTLSLQLVDLDDSALHRLFYGYSLSTTPIEKLILFNCEIIGEIADIIPQLQLKRLELQQSYHAADWIRRARGFQKYERGPQEIRLVVHHCPVDGREAAAIAEIVKKQRVTHFACRGTFHNDVKIIYPAIAAGSNLVKAGVRCDENEVDLLAKTLQNHPTIAQVDLWRGPDLKTERKRAQLATTLNRLLESNTKIIEMKLEGRRFIELDALTVRNQIICLENAPNDSALPYYLRAVTKSAVFAFLRRNSNRAFAHVLEGIPQPVRKKQRKLEGESNALF